MTIKNTEFIAFFMKIVACIFYKIL